MTFPAMNMGKFIKRISRQRANRNEIPQGALSELDLFAQAFHAKTDVEQDMMPRRILDRMTERTRQISAQDPVIRSQTISVGGRADL